MNSRAGIAPPLKSRTHYNTEVFPVSIFGPIPSLSGNLAIDLGIVGVGMAVVIRCGFKLWHYGEDLAKQRTHAAQLNDTLEAKHEKVCELREAFLRARANTEAALQPYLEDRENRMKLAASAVDREVDPQYAELEEQLKRATGKRPPLEH